VTESATVSPICELAAIGTPRRADRPPSRNATREVSAQLNVMRALTITVWEEVCGAGTLYR
jgi:hypothetical protein